MSSAASRSWAGTTLADRRSERRARLLDVGLELLGTQGSTAVSVRSVCRQAKLTDRYFYENFADRDEFVLAVYDQVAAEASSALICAVAAHPTADGVETVARAATEAFLGVLTDDPRKGRILLLEPLSDPSLGIRSVAVAPMFAELVRGSLGAEATAQGAELTATALVGALANVFIRWLDGTLVIERDALIDYCVRLLVVFTDLAR
ncbi:MAG: TetR family transcriptional regulator [Jatrophihabitantaceae bacterium]